MHTEDDLFDLEKLPYLHLSDIEGEVTEQTKAQVRVYNGQTLILIEAINRHIQSGEGRTKKYHYWPELLQTLEAFYHHGGEVPNTPFFVSIKALVETSELPKARVKKYVQTLMELGLITISGRGGSVSYSMIHTREQLIEAGMRVEGFQAQ
ncbi:hypothetical protein [Magnetococcus sp. PR-3]|uniref:hypothetical protein n=1 Tax=Magnetococcus sp. PR-3 TaxID=3120355 RepID=UPI002FCE57A1